MRQLVQLVETHLSSVPVLPVSPLWEFDAEGRLADTSGALRQSLGQLTRERRVMPLFHGDVVLHDGQLRVLSGDCIAPFVAKLVGASRLVFCSSCAVLAAYGGPVVTVIADDGDECQLADGRRLRRSELSFSVPSSASDVTGAMGGKLAAALAYAGEAVVAPLAELECAVRGQRNERMTVIRGRRQ